MSPSERSVGILTTDRNLIIHTWDDWLSRATGIPPEQARGEPLVSVIPAAAARGWRERFESAIQEGLVQVMAPMLHHYLVPCPPSKPSRYFDQMQQHVTVAPLREENNIVGAIITIEDVTARCERERELLEQLASPDEATRLRAAEAIAAEDPGASARMLMGALEDESWRVRRVAVNHLAQSGGPEAAAALVRALKEEHQNLGVLNSALQILYMSGLDTVTSLVELLEGPDVELRIYSALALGEQQNSGSIPALMAALDDPDANVRYHVIEALGKLRARQAVERLVAVARSGDFFVAFAALEALAQIGDSRAVPQLIPLLEDELLCAPTAQLLGQVGDEQAVVPLVTALNEHPDLTPSLAQALITLYDQWLAKHHNGEQIVELARAHLLPRGLQNLMNGLDRANAAELRAIAVVLGWVPSTAADTALTRLLGNPSLRKEVVEALVRHGSEVMELLLQSLQSGDLETRQAAGVALGRIGDARAVPALINILADETNLIVIAAGALAKIGDPRAFQALLPLLGHPSPAVRQAAISALNSLGHPDMGAHLIILLRDDEPRVRESAAKIAGYFGYPECTEALFGLTGDPDQGVRRAAIESIAYLDDDARVTGVLVRALASDVPAVRAAAARGLAHVDRAETLSHLMAALRDPDCWVRYFAARSIGRQRRPETAGALAQLAQNDPFNPVRLAAIEALGRLGGGLVTETLTSLQQDADPDIAQAASSALENKNTGSDEPVP